ncbi:MULTISPECIES: tetratricopeptide repeat protein [unclassified Rhizobacter]|uniref:tetratricopeptide repeat protein n=1 Tax=unclassified Rhizobacter TaxID=2640088 RepID=UPI00138F1AE2|nr:MULTISPECIES: tetratricopeptide repeat protein [unclassified Rhizobacter]
MPGWLRRFVKVKAAATPAPTASPADDVAAWRVQADDALKRGDLAGAADGYERVLSRAANDASTQTSLGFVRMQQGRTAEAVALLTSASRDEGVAHDALFMLGSMCEQTGDLAAAIDHYRRAILNAPRFDVAIAALARVLVRNGQREAARALLEEAVERAPRFADHHLLLGRIELEEGRHDPALARLGASVELAPGDAGAWTALGLALRGARRPHDAVAAFEKAVQLDPTQAHALRELGSSRYELGELRAAADALQASLVLDPRNAVACSNLSSILLQLGRLQAAEQAGRQAVSLDATLAGAHNNLGNALIKLQRAQDALPCFEAALALKPDFADAAVNLAQALGVLKRRDEAHAVIERAMALNDQAPWLYGTWLHGRMAVCDWTDLPSRFDELARRIDRGERATTPWPALPVPLSAAQQLAVSTIYSASNGWPQLPPLPPHASHDRIRIGYFSADFHQHATSYLMVELFERHDRGRFEVIAFSFGPRSQDAMRQRLERAFDRFVDVHDLDDAQIVQRARELEIDIAVDLKGFTEDCRPGIFAGRAAPLQVSYIGYPGTMGAGFIDYLLADATVVPPGGAIQQACSEKLVFLPDSYQVNDSKRPIASLQATRTNAGLPPDGFVYCCFNNNYKITPDVFDAWMRVLQAVPGSVLWLLQDNEAAAANLRREAHARGVDPQRLVFAPRVAMPEHLARHRLADLFLDTLYCNAHTTASDALWAGLPLLSRAGETFAARVAASLLRACGLPELVVDDLHDYEQLAIRLADDPQRLAELRHRLAEARSTCPLFDTDRFTRGIERAYVAMMQRLRDGLAPDHLMISGDPVAATGNGSIRN